MTRSSSSAWALPARLAADAPVAGKGYRCSTRSGVVRRRRNGLPADSVEIRTAQGEAGIGGGGNPTVERTRPGVCDEDGDFLYIEDVSGADEAVGGDLSVVPQSASANVEDVYDLGFSRAGTRDGASRASTCAVTAPVDRYGRLAVPQDGRRGRFGTAEGASWTVACQGPMHSSVVGSSESAATSGRDGATMARVGSAESPVQRPKADPLCRIGDPQ
jgi:hypothetical protein